MIVCAIALAASLQATPLPATVTVHRTAEEFGFRLDFRFAEPVLAVRPTRHVLPFELSASKGDKTTSVLAFNSGPKRRKARHLARRVRAAGLFEVQVLDAPATLVSEDLNGFTSLPAPGLGDGAALLHTVTWPAAFACSFEQPGLDGATEVSMLAGGVPFMAKERVGKKITGWTPRFGSSKPPASWTDGVSFEVEPRGTSKPIKLTAPPFPRAAQQVWFKDPKLTELDASFRCFREYPTHRFTVTSGQVLALWVVRADGGRVGPIAAEKGAVEMVLVPGGEWAGFDLSGADHFAIDIAAGAVWRPVAVARATVFRPAKKKRRRRRRR
jgi:hypothetical protein